MQTLSTTVEIKPITATNRIDATYLEPRIEQQAYIPAVRESLRKAAETKAMAFGIYSGEEMVGFFLLNPQGPTLWIEGFFIDQSFQRRGIASRAIEKLPMVVRRLGTFNRLAIQISTTNGVCDSFYHKLGFYTEPTSDPRTRIFAYHL